MALPLVSCIMPTANRQRYIPFAIDYFSQQNYPNKELVIIDDGAESIAALLPNNPQIRYFYTEPLGTIGKKRNYAIEQSRGSIIMHWDDDDWHAYDWINKQVDILLTTGADVCGLKQAHYFSVVMDKLLQDDTYKQKDTNFKTWLNGATLAYWKSYWEKHPFNERKKTDNDDFIQYRGAKVIAHDYIDGFIAMLHPDNTTVKLDENLKIKRLV